MTKQGAMFGLDARIALAIFGALSVISGAALYSAIQDSKATALLTEINEVGKAWEQYMLDTGSDLPLYSNGGADRHRNVYELISSSVNGWKGPYLPYVQDPTDVEFIAMPNSYRISIPATTNLQWGMGHPDYDTWAHNSIKCNDTTIPCYSTIQLALIKNTSDILNIAKTLDNKVDNGDGAFKGKVRWYTETTFDVIAYIYAPHKIPK